MSSNNKTGLTRQQHAARMKSERDRAQAKRRNFQTAVIILVVIALVALASFAISGQKNKHADVTATPSGLTHNGGIVYDQQTFTGSSTPSTTVEPVKVIVFEDFQCPICRNFEQTNGAFLQQQVESGAISVEYVPVSFLDAQSTTEYSSRALGAAMCVYADQGAQVFRKFHDLLYANQPDEGSAGLSDSQLAQIAKQTGSLTAGACIEDQKYKTWATSTKDRIFTMSDSAGTKVSGTPTVWVDGKAVSGPKQNGQSTMARVADLRDAIATAAN